MERNQQDDESIFTAMKDLGFTKEQVMFAMQARSCAVPSTSHSDGRRRDREMSRFLQVGCLRMMLDRYKATMTVRKRRGRGRGGGGDGGGGDGG